MKKRIGIKKTCRKRTGSFSKKVWFALWLSLGLISLPLYGSSKEGATVIKESMQQNRKITGNVVDDSGETLPSASVRVKDSTIGTTTDSDGNFSLDIPENAVLIVSYVGYKPQEITVGNQQHLSITMVSDSELLDEIVVVGYGVVKKSDLTGSVGSIKAETISSKGSTSVLESMQGQVPGVNISQSSSRAGDGFNMAIRGKSSLGGGSPLYVIDGVVCENMNFLNPMDIEKVDILKDASSTAIYGSRATNGVVMITTKKGDANATRTTVSYDGYYGVKSVANMPDFMDGDQFMNWRFARYLVSTMNTSTGLTDWEMTEANMLNFWGAGSPVVKAMYRDKNYTDWADVVTRTGSQQNHFVNVSGNAKDISYRVGLGYQKEDGIYYDSYERWNIKGAVDHKISDKLSAGFSTNLATSLQHKGSENSILTAFRMTPAMPAYYWDGPLKGQPIPQPGKDEVVYPDGGGPTSTISPVTDRLNSKDDTRLYDVMANVYFQYTPVKEVILKTTISPQYSKRHDGKFYNDQSQLRTGKTNLTESTNDEMFSYTWDTQANFIKEIDDHSFNVLALVSAYRQKYTGDGITVTDMPFDVDWHNLGSGVVQTNSSYFKKFSMLSYVARINYAYKGKYLLTVSSRWDGSSRFEKENRWGMFPSAALAWRLSEEDFLKSTPWINNLKLRASYGVTGNNAGVGAYDTKALANIKYFYNFGGTVANGYGYTITNPNLTWETTTEFNLGIDFGLFKNRVNGTIDIYNKDSKDLLMEMKTPYELGSYSGAVISNVGKVNNKGIEIQLNTVNVTNKDWNWETSFSFARNINKIVELNDAKEDLVGNKWFIGQPIDVVYGYKYMGICTREEAQAFASDANWKTKFYEGEMKLYDKDGNGTINADDKMVLGHYAPTWTGGFSTTVRYKNFDFSASIYTSQGGTVYSPFMGEFADYNQRGMQRLNLDFYYPGGAPALGADGSISTQASTHYGSFPFPTNGTNGKGGGANWLSGDNQDRTYNFVDNSYVKVKNISLGYTIPKATLSKIHVSNLRVYINVLNPFTFTDYMGFDPEWADTEIGDGRGGVSSRTFQAGLNLTF